ncbi:MAG: hypothetical protein ABR585_13685 [Gemmatimonadaceae bacterium]|nr:hypothetical protein [Actinomycetota bacterium]
MPSALIVEYYMVQESQRLNDKYPKHCDECTYPPVWVARLQFMVGESQRLGYGCGDHIDTIMMKMVYNIPPGEEKEAPAE